MRWLIIVGIGVALLTWHVESKARPAPYSVRINGMEYYRDMPNDTFTHWAYKSSDGRLYRHEK
jgi:hypothetical protein